MLYYLAVVVGIEPTSILINSQPAHLVPLPHSMAKIAGLEPV